MGVIKGAALLGSPGALGRPSDVCLPGQCSVG
jgi:hypothetical protein